MPPKKKPRVTGPAEPENNGQAASNTPGSGESSAKPETDYDLVADPWTDEQETALLKAIIKWKPVGMHKHFRMIAVSEFMKSQGYASSHTEHTRIPGTWKKLGTLYNLPGLDEREDSLMTDVTDDADSSTERYCPFELPEEEYGDLMFARRLATEGTESVTSGRAESRTGSTTIDTDEARSSPAQSRGRKSTRGGRQGARGSTRTKRQAEAEESRKDTATGEEDEDEEDTGANDEADEEASDVAKEDSDAEEEAEEEAGGSRSTRAQTSRSKQKDRGGGAGTRRTGRRR